MLAGDGDFGLIGVMDGHGVFGEKVSQFLAKILPKVVEKYLKEVMKEKW